MKKLLQFIDHQLNDPRLRYDITSPPRHSPNEPLFPSRISLSLSISLFCTFYSLCLNKDVIELSLCMRESS